MTTITLRKRLPACFTLATLLLAALPAAAQRQCKSDCGIIDIGQPKLWSLRDAQYLVGEARERLKALRVSLPNEPAAPGQIDTNEINQHRLDILLQALGVNAQFDQSTLANNRQAQQKYERDKVEYEKTLAQREKLDRQIQEQTVARKGLDAEVESKTTLGETLKAQSEATDSEVKATRDELADFKAAHPEPTPSDLREIERLSKAIADLTDSQRTLRQKRLNNTIELADLTSRRDSLARQSAELEAQKKALGDPQAPALTLASTGPSETGITQSNALSALLSDAEVKKALTDSIRKAIADDPRAPYIVQLNNVVDGYLQTISHRLTMLRQSIDPNYDLYFFEGNTSIEPSSKAAQHIARARWIIGETTVDWGALAAEFIDDDDFQDLVALAVRTQPRLPAPTGPTGATGPSGTSGKSGGTGAVGATGGKGAGQAQGAENSPAVRGPIGATGATGIAAARKDSSAGPPITETYQTIRKQLNEPGEGRVRRENEKKEDEKKSQIFSEVTAGRGAAQQDETAQGRAAREAQETAQKLILDSGVARDQKLLDAIIQAGCSDDAKEIDFDAATVREFANWICWKTNADGKSPLNKPAGTTEEGYRSFIARAIIAANGGIYKVRPILQDSGPVVFELSPAQGAVNVAVTRVRENRVGVVGIFKTLIGIGGGADYQRQRDTFSQFLQQDVFLASQGKGSRKQFGWDYAPLPGAEFVAAGSYTTYGVLAVPSFRRSIEFKTAGDWILRPSAGGKSRQVALLANDTCAEAVLDGGVTGGCNRDIYSSGAGASIPDANAYRIYLPNRRDLWVDSIYYSSVPRNEEISVIIRGKGFTPEIAVLVNNLPLEPRWRLIDPNAGDLSNAATSTGGTKANVESGRGNLKVEGSFEVTTDTIVLRFRATDFSGIPLITLVSPHRSIHLNQLPLRINDNPRKRYLQALHDSFVKGSRKDDIMFEPGSDWRRISAPEFLYVSDEAQKVDVRFGLAGIPFGPTGRLEILDGTTWTGATVDRDQLVPVVVVRDAPITNGYLSLKFSEGTQLVLQHRVAVFLRPIITGVTPDKGPAAGGTDIKITGKNFAHAEKVFFGTREVEILARTDAEISVRAPKGDPEAKVKLRVVGGARDGKILASVESREYAYAAAAPTPKLEIIHDAKFGKLDAETPVVEFSVAADLPAGATEPTFWAQNGTTWISLAKKTEKVSGDRFNLSGVPVHRGTVELRLSVKQGGETIILADRVVFPVPFTPNITKASISASPGEVVVLTGRNLWLVDKVVVGKAVLTPETKDYERLSFRLPKAEDLQRAGPFPVFVYADGKLGTGALTLSLR